MHTRTRTHMHTHARMYDDEYKEVSNNQTSINPSINNQLINQSSSINQSIIIQSINNQSIINNQISKSNYEDKSIITKFKKITNIIFSGVGKIMNIQSPMNRPGGYLLSGIQRGETAAENTKNPTRVDVLSMHPWRVNNPLRERHKVPTPQASTLLVILPRKQTQSKHEHIHITERK